MAQSSQKSRRATSSSKQSGSSSKGSRSSGGRSSGRARTSGNGASASRSTAKSQASRRSQSSRRRPASKPATTKARDAVVSGAQDAGSAIGTAASKAKRPAMAGGAALAGLVGGMAIAARGGRRRVLGVPVPGTRRPLVKIKSPRRNNVAKDVVKAAGEMGTAGRQMAELATEVRLARQQLDNGRRRSPVEVVLEGLTSRRPRS
jgi:hypothetical protein